MNPFIILVSLIVAIMVIPAVAPLFRRKSAQPAGTALPGSVSRGPKSPTIVSDVPFYGGGIPEDFPVESFLRNTMDTFVQLRSANDSGKLGAIRSHVTREMFEKLSGQLQAHGDAPGRIEVVGLKSDLLEVIDTGDSAVANVRLSGQLRTDGGEAEKVDEIWQVCKGLRNEGEGWLLANIRPVS